MNLFFEIGTEYDRDDLLAFTGSQQNRTGIIWGNKEPGCLIVTTGGKHATNAGYSDERNPDGSWNYIGQGSEGHQDITKFANTLLTNQERNILLFSTREPNTKEFQQRGSRRKFYRYEGMFDAISWKFITPTTGKRKGHQLIQVLLYPTHNIYHQDSVSPPVVQVPPANLASLRAEIKKTQHTGSKKLTVTEYRQRSSLVKAYALSRANGICECCNKIAPFKTVGNIPFLEVHHIQKLADDGPDTCENVAALCPNCHREAHFGINKDQIKVSLLKKIALIEAKITPA